VPLEAWLNSRHLHPILRTVCPADRVLLLYTLGADRTHNCTPGEETGNRGLSKVYQIVTQRSLEKLEADWVVLAGAQAQEAVDRILGRPCDSELEAA